jgi:hypothetical protein
MSFREEIFQVLRAVKRASEEADKNGWIDVNFIDKPSDMTKGNMRSILLGLSAPDWEDFKNGFEEDILSYGENTQEDIDEGSPCKEIGQSVKIGKDFNKYYKKIESLISRKIYDIYTDCDMEECNKGKVNSYRNSAHRNKYDIWIDEEREEVYKKGKEVFPKPRSFILLLFFIKNIDKLKHRDFINEYIRESNKVYKTTKRSQKPEAEVGASSLMTSIYRLHNETKNVLKPFLEGKANNYRLRSEITNNKKKQKLKYFLISPISEKA